MIPKFRVWLKKKKKMVASDDLVNISFEDEEICVQTLYFEEGLISERDLDYYEFDEIEFIQPTGVKDLKGIEIFEGDIVRVLDSTYTVFYDNERGSYRLKPHDDRWNVDYMSNFSHGGNFEVVGNIYENQEYLKKRGD
nr:MAG TPA: YopX protein [Caudoviricetes sp.]